MFRIFERIGDFFFWLVPSLKPPFESTNLTQDGEAYLSKIAREGSAEQQRLKAEFDALFDELADKMERNVNEHIRAETQRILDETLSESAAQNAEVRWAWRDEVWQWMREIRLAHPKPRSRASVIRDEMLPSVRERARQAGGVLSGSDDSVIETLTRWCREAGIK